MEFHEAANIFPLDDEHVDDLAGDIRAHGLQVTIETLGGKIIDGRRRFMACKLAGVTPKFRAVTVDDPVAYVLSLNLHRRHLSPTQLAMVGARARELYDQQAKERMVAGKGSDGSGGRGRKTNPMENLPQGLGTARDAAGKAVGVSGKSIDHATAVLRRATSELVAAVDADLVSVSTAARASSTPVTEQRALVERAKANGKRTRPRPTELDGPDESSNGEVKSRGVGIIRANEAINCLTRIPKNDALRKRGFQLVTDWIRKNK